MDSFTHVFTGSRAQPSDIYIRLTLGIKTNTEVRVARGTAGCILWELKRDWHIFGHALYCRCLGAEVAHCYMYVYAVVIPASAPDFLSQGGCRSLHWWRKTEEGSSGSGDGMHRTGSGVHKNVSSLHSKKMATGAR